MTLDYAKARENMVEQQVRPWDVLDTRVLETIATLPREVFVPEALRALAYADTALPLGHGESMMKPVLEGRALQALLPQAMAYTPQQAAQVFHGLFADFYPPTVDGKTVTDMVALQRLDWAQLTDAYWNDAETRREFCTRLDQLQRDAGYTGPVAPLR